MRRFVTAITAVILVAALLGLSWWVVRAQNGQTYTVQPGDTLYSIGVRFGVSSDAIAQANNISLDDTIFVGQTLTIPASDNAASPSPTATSQPPTATSAGQQPTYVIITTTPLPTPTGPTPTSLPPAVIVTAGSASAPANSAGGAAGTYTVQPGDTLFHIATMFNTTTAVLMQMNGISNANVITVGQVLSVPGGSGSNTAPGQPSSQPTPQSTLQIAPLPIVPNTVPFGIGVVANVSADNLSSVVNSVKDLGASWIRLNVSWRQMEPNKGQVDYTALDNEVNALNGTGVQILFTVSTAPDWSRSVNTENGPPTNLSDFATFIGTLAARYKGKVQAYEVWSEPNIRREWNGVPLSAAMYIQLLQAAYHAIKAADSAAIVVSAGLAPTGFNDGVNAIADRVYLKAEYAAGLAASADAIGAHPDGYSNPPDSACCTASAGVTGWFNDPSFYFLGTLKDYRAIMNQSGDSGRVIWVTQIGWGSSEGVTANGQTVDPNLGYVLTNTQAKLAQYLPRSFELGRTLGYIGPMLVYNLNACQTESNPPTSTEVTACYYSLIDGSGNPRPAYQAVKAARK